MQENFPTVSIICSYPQKALRTYLALGSNISPGRLVISHTCST